MCLIQGASRSTRSRSIRQKEIRRLPVVGVPHVVDEGGLRDFAIEPVLRLALAFPVGAVVVAGLRLDFGDSLRVVFGHPTIDVIEEWRIIPDAFTFQKVYGEGFTDPGD